MDCREPKLKFVLGWIQSMDLNLSFGVGISVSSVGALPVSINYSLELGLKPKVLHLSALASGDVGSVSFFLCHSD